MCKRTRKQEIISLLWRATKCLTETENRGNVRRTFPVNILKKTYYRIYPLHSFALFCIPFLYIFLFWFYIFHVISGAIVRDGDRKRAPFLVLGLSPWYGTIFLFLEQIEQWPFAHARTCCKDFCRRREQEMVSKISEIVHAFCPQLQLEAFMSVGILLKYFRRKLFQFEWSKTVSNLGMSCFLTDQVCVPLFLLQKLHITPL